MHQLYIDMLASIRPAFLGSALANLLRIERVDVLTANGTFWADPFSHFGRTLLHQGSYEPAMTEVFETFSLPGSTVVDLGSNEGFFTVLASNLVGPNDRVLAVEPQPRQIDIIRKNLQLNGCRNVEIAPVAISDQEGHAQLYLSSRANSGASSLFRPTRYRLPVIKVRLVNLERLFLEFGLDRVALLKMDIEGAEVEALAGSQHLLAQGRIDTIAVELHEATLRRRGYKPSEVLDSISRHGYRQTSYGQMHVFRL